jgi:hypothetical protein
MSYGKQVSVAGQNEKGNSAVESGVKRPMCWRICVGLRAAVLADREQQDHQHDKKQHHREHKSAARSSGYSALNHNFVRCVTCQRNGAVYSRISFVEIRARQFCDERLCNLKLGLLPRFGSQKEREPQLPSLLM